MKAITIRAPAVAGALAMICTLARGEEVALPLPLAEPWARIAVAPESMPPPSGTSVEKMPVALAEKPFTLAEAEMQATAFHPALKAAGARVRAARGNWVQVGLQPNPEIGYSGSEIGNDGRAGQQGGFVSQEIVRGNKLELNRAVAAREQAEAETRVEITRWQVVTTVRKSYFELLAAERSLALARQLNEIAAQSVSVSQRRLQAMDVPKTSLLQSQIESESAALLEQQGAERVAAARRRLAAALGAPDRQFGNLEDVFSQPLPELSYETVRDRLAADSPELAEFRVAVERARWAVARASAGRKQNVNVQAGVQYDNATEDPIANVQLSMPIPLHDRNQGAIAQACGELAAAQAALEARQIAIDQRLAAALRDYQTARERVSKYTDKILPAAKETLELINTGYRQGELDYTQVYNVQQTYAAKNLSYLQDLQTAWQRWAEIDGFLVGDLASDSGAEPVQTQENVVERRF